MLGVPAFVPELFFSLLMMKKDLSDLIFKKELYNKSLNSIYLELCGKRKYDYSQFLKNLTNTVFQFINSYFQLHLPTPKFVAGKPKDRSKEFWAGQFIYRNYTRFVGLKKEFNRDWKPRVKIATDYEYTFGEALAIIAHEILHYYIEYNNFFDLWDHGPTYRFFMWSWNLDFKELGFPKIKLGAQIIGNRND